MAASTVNARKASISVSDLGSQDFWVAEELKRLS